MATPLIIFSSRRQLIDTTYRMRYAGMLHSDVVLFIRQYTQLLLLLMMTMRDGLKTLMTLMLILSVFCTTICASS